MSLQPGFDFVFLCDGMLLCFETLIKSISIRKSETVAESGADSEKEEKLSRCN